MIKYNVSDKMKEKPVADIPKGDLFKDNEGGVYIKTDEEDVEGELLCVNIADGCVIYFDPKLEVFPLVTINTLELTFKRVKR